MHAMQANDVNASMSFGSHYINAHDFGTHGDADAHDDNDAHDVLIRRASKVGMPPYGNCFLASLAHQRGENPLDMDVIAEHRREICDHIECNEEEMKPFLSYTADNNNDDNYENDCAMELAVQNSIFTEHVRKMRLVDKVEGPWSDHAWATNAEVQAASVVYSLHILIYEVASDGILRLYNSIGKKGDHEISLLYNGQHYDSLIPEADHTALTMEESLFQCRRTTTTHTTTTHTTLLPTTTRDDELMRRTKMRRRDGRQVAQTCSLLRIAVSKISMTPM